MHGEDSSYDCLLLLQDLSLTVIASVLPSLMPTLDGSARLSFNSLIYEEQNGSLHHQIGKAVRLAIQVLLVILNASNEWVRATMR